MNTWEELLNDQDPDYVSADSNSQARQKIYEENARNNTAKRIIAIIEKEFSRDIEKKQKEILQIQEQLSKASRTLHWLRYVIVTDFYNRKQCQLPQAAEASKQKRIHPAIKSLVGKRPKYLNCTEPSVPSTSTDPRFLSTDESSALEAKSPTIKTENADSYSNNESLSTRKRTLPADEEPQPRKMPRYVPPKSSVPENSTQPSRGNKVHKRIIVGNLSKWIPLEWRDNSDATHKWSMYVRGDKNATDISTYVNKVRFFLHPSYSPNNVVDVTSYPFHLSRRGWGEFPLRVQLHFKNTLNKPLDIVHNLKLDRTYTGLQMLGSETVVNLWIYDADSRSCNDNVNNNEPFKLPAKNMRVKVEPLSNDDGTESVSVGPSTSRFFENAFEGTQVKKEPDVPEICQPFDPTVSLALVEKSAETQVKTVSDNETDKAVSGVPFCIEEMHLDNIRFNIYHDHLYAKEQYPKSRNTIKDGNITIEHFLINETADETDSSTADVNGKKSVGTITTLHKCNGDIQSSNDSQPSTLANAKDTERREKSKTQESSGHVILQKSDNPKKNLLSSDMNESSQATDLPNDEIPAEILESAAKGATMINGFCKPFNHVVFDQLKNLKTATNANNLHLKPLKISIPPFFAPSTGKRIVLMKDKILDPMDKKKPNDSDMKVHEKNNRLTISDFSRSKPMLQGTSILKKQPFKVKMNAKNTNKKAVLTFRNTNSLLLNMNYSEPALKIADPCDPQYNYSLSDAVKGISSSSSSIGNREGAKSTDKEEKTTQRTRITLGKDKHKLQSKRELYEAVFRSINLVNITNTEAFMRFVIRRLPIVTQDARDPEYRCLHPYACCSEDNFFALSLGKQRALEWHRAKIVKSYLRKKLLQDDEQLWSVKEILLWARLHGYTPSRSVIGMSNMNVASTSTKRLLDSSTSTCTEPVAFHKWLQACREESSHRSTNHSVDEIDMIEIDVVTVDEGPCKGTIDRRKDEHGPGDPTVASSTLTPLELDENLMPLHKFVCNTAQEIGIKIAPEEIVPGVVYCAASRVIMRVIECFVEDLTRSSLAKAWERNNGDGHPRIITLDDVRNALTSREEFDIFTNEGLGSQQQLSTTN